MRSHQGGVIAPAAAAVEMAASCLLSSSSPPPIQGNSTNSPGSLTLSGSAYAYALTFS